MSASFSLAISFRAVAQDMRHPPKHNLTSHWGIRSLIEARADPNMGTAYDMRTPLHLAAAAGCLATLGVISHIR